MENFEEFYPVNSKIDLQSSVQIFSNKKILLLTTPKIAHSWCRDNFIEPSTKEISDFNIHKNTFNLVFFEDKEEKTEYQKIQEKIWINFLEKKEKRDIIILYRNPFEHLCSALMQDWIKKPIPPSSLPFYHFCFESLNLPKIKKTEVLSKITQNYFSGFDKNFITMYPEVFELIVKIILDYILASGSLISGHYTLWLSFVKSLIESDKFDKSKIRLIDIYDAPLDIQLQNYLDSPVTLETTNTGRYKEFEHTHSKIKKVILENEIYKKQIQILLHNEFSIYNEFKSKK